MYDRVLKKMREKIRIRQYVMTLHAEEEMNNDNLSIFDVESCILSGNITQRQKDTATSEWKYLVKGHTLEGDNVTIVGKLSLTEKLVIITLFRE